MPGDTLGVGVCRGVRHHCQPLLEFVVGTGTDVELGRRRRIGPDDRAAENVLEGLEPVATRRKHLTDLGFGEVCQLDLGRSTVGREGLLDEA